MFELGPKTPQRFSIALMFCVLGFPIFCSTSAKAQDENTNSKKAEAPAFRGELLGVKVAAAALAIVLDVSESMNLHLPAIQKSLKEKTPKNPVIHVDGSGVERPEPRARVVHGIAPETITAIETIAQHTTATSILWITDMGDPPNRNGIESLEEVLSTHGLQLILLSTENKPSPSIRKVIGGTEGYWDLIEPKK